MKEDNKSAAQNSFCLMGRRMYSFRLCFQGKKKSKLPKPSYFGSGVHFSYLDRFDFAKILSRVGRGKKALGGTTFERGGSMSAADSVMEALC